MIPLKQNPPAPIADVAVVDRKVVIGVLGTPVVAGTIRLSDLHGQIVLEWRDDDVDQTLHDMATQASYAVGDIDIEVFPHTDSNWITIQARAHGESRELKVIDFDFFDLVAKAMADNASWSRRQIHARALEVHRRGI